MQSFFISFYLLETSNDCSYSFKQINNKMIKFSNYEIEFEDGDKKKNKKPIIVKVREVAI